MCRLFHFTVETLFPHGYRRGPTHGRGTHRVHCRHHRDAFTLVELLVVIGIILILISILLPVLGRGREQARTVWCASNISQIYKALLMYAAGRAGNWPAAE